jgi:hypothetical protein
MKKIFTVLLSVGVFATSFAQTGHQNKDKRNDQYVTTNSNNNFKKFDDHRDAIYTFSAKERDMQIAKINSNFNLKVKSIVSNRRIKKSEKKVLIKKAQQEKEQQIDAVNAKFNCKFNTAFNDHKKYDNRKH